jgi:hypothetical protein
MSYGRPIGIKEAVVGLSGSRIGVSPTVTETRDRRELGFTKTMLFKGHERNKPDCVKPVMGVVWKWKSCEFSKVQLFALEMVRVR